MIPLIATLVVIAAAANRVVKRERAARRVESVAKRAEELTRAYAAWARDARFVEHGFDGRYRGTIEGVDVIVDNGARASDCWAVEVRVGIATGDPCGTVGAVDEPATRLRAVVSTLCKSSELITRVRVERDAIVLLLPPELPPESAEAAARELMDAWRVTPESIGPYR